MTIHRYLSPAKVNLFLRVLNRREDGYHNIVTVMQPVSLYDEIFLKVEAGEGIFVECNNKSIPCDKTNLAYRAGETFFGFAGIKGKRLSVNINKNIPVSAGLGGGSSNAATVLKALNEIASANISAEDLMKIGATIGSDVPFFINGKSSIASGRGETLEPIALPQFWYTLINPGFPVSTKWAYQNLNLTKKQENINIIISKVLTAYGTGNLEIRDVSGLLMNDLEDVTIKKHPEINEIKRLLIDFGAVGALMSGSGPTVFGVFRDEDKAGTAFARIKQDQRFKNMAVFVAKGL